LEATIFSAGGCGFSAGGGSLGAGGGVALTTARGGATGSCLRAGAGGSFSSRSSFSRAAAWPRRLSTSARDRANAFFTTGVAI
jgi:hypothetical protein